MFRVWSIKESLSGELERNELFIMNDYAINLFLVYITVNGPHMAPDAHRAPHQKTTKEEKNLLMLNMKSSSLPYGF